eukprot:2244310-Heterocapsa_arctica.AAC.1
MVLREKWCWNSYRTVAIQDALFCANCASLRNSFSQSCRRSEARSAASAVTSRLRECAEAGPVRARSRFRCRSSSRCS